MATYMTIDESLTGDITRHPSTTQIVMQVLFFLYTSGALRVGLSVVVGALGLGIGFESRVNEAKDKEEIKKELTKDHKARSLVLKVLIFLKKKKFLVWSLAAVVTVLGLEAFAVELPPEDFRMFQRPSWHGLYGW